MRRLEAPIRLVETSYNHNYLEIPTEGWPITRRWEWIKALLTGKDIVYRSRLIQHVDLRPKEDGECEKEKGNL